MSKRNINGDMMFSMESISNDFLHSTSRKTVYQFINFLVSVDIINKKAVKYGERVHYVYTPSAWFDMLVEGRIYREPRKYKGETINGTIYFDKYTSTVLSRLYRHHNIAKKSRNREDMLYRIMVQTALEFLPKPSMNVDTNKPNTVSK